MGTYYGTSNMISNNIVYIKKYAFVKPIVIRLWKCPITNLHMRLFSLRPLWLGRCMAGVFFHPISRYSTLWAKNILDWGLNFVIWSFYDDQTKYTQWCLGIKIIFTQVHVWYLSFLHTCLVFFRADNWNEQRVFLELLKLQAPIGLQRNALNAKLMRVIRCLAW